MDNTQPPFTIDDITSCWDYYRHYLADILNGDYPLEEAREDLRGLIGSQFDRRTDQNTDSAK